MRLPPGEEGIAHGVVDGGGLGGGGGQEAVQGAVDGRGATGVRNRGKSKSCFVPAGLRLRIDAMTGLI